MESHERRKEGALLVVGQDGRQQRLTLYVTYFVLNGRGGSQAKVPRRSNWELDDGRVVERVDDETSTTFTVVETGEVLRA